MTSLMAISMNNTVVRFMRDLSGVDPSWLAELAPHFYDFKPRIQQPPHANSGPPPAKKARVEGPRLV